MPMLASQLNFCFRIMRLNILLILIGTLVGLFIAELGIRIYTAQLFSFKRFNFDYVEVIGGHKIERVKYDPTLGWIPNAGIRIVNGKTYSVNKDSTRLNGTNRKFPTDKNQILAVGDSFTFGHNVSDSDAWPAQLENEIGRSVVNGGVFGYGLDQIILRSKSLYKEYEPEILLVSFITEDIFRCGQKVRGWPKPYYTISQGKLSLVTDHIAAMPRNLELGLTQKYLGYSNLADVIFRRVAPNWWLSNSVVVVDSNNYVAAPRQPDRNIDIACLLMSELAELKKGNTNIVVIAQYIKSLNDAMHQSSRVVLDCANKLGLKTLDLFDPLNNIAKSRPEIFNSYYSDHMTPQGNSFIAKEIKKYLKNEGLVAF